ncbi:sigma-54-dependent transcriptional regulator [Methylobrevis pamukkalensis]|uniref:DNA-binding transcriptional regulator NtrC n=1 Tax=Methylobrevis pamukkalensis TaxID=1439726 RepID=A0A1E3GYM5_9HYPH|nr:sigma-54 dependent transcriptional regulator [Methylobrevis pamukkalensis]ODN68646.1 Transcriptional regulatory protein ZraR [Methylobrevis pamukkalensis]
MAGRILIVDDDPIQRRLLEEALRRFGYAPDSVDGGPAALAYLGEPRGSDIDLVILDLVMPELDGMAVLERLARAGFDRPVIVQTARGGIDTVVGAMRAGAFDFIVKPVNHERLQVAVQNALKVTALEGEIQRLKKTVAGTLTFRDLVTRSPAMERVIRLGEKAAVSMIPILIEGESGVGKEMIARAIQGTSDRRSRPFVTVNCGAIPDNLVESTLFGHEKGAFTGAVDKHVGKFQEAHTGTLFLDEVGELPLDIQVKLLRAIQEGEIDPVGARRPAKVDLRIISATNRNMIDLVKEGRFREDLYYRLNVFPIHVPPLRERREDIPDLTRHFIARFAAEEGKRKVTGLRADALDLLTSYHWPGNIRQLENTIFRAVVLSDGDVLTVDEFPQIAAQVGHASARRRVEDPLGQTSPSSGAPSGVPDDGMIGKAITGSPFAGGESRSLFADAALPRASTPVAAAPVPMSPMIGTAIGRNGTDPAPFGFLRSLADDGHIRSLNSLEEDMIRLAIEHYGGRMAEVARRLGIGRSTLYRKLREYGLDGGDAEDTVAAE